MSAYMGGGDRDEIDYLFSVITVCYKIYPTYLTIMVKLLFTAH